MLMDSANAQSRLPAFRWPLVGCSFDIRASSFRPRLDRPLIWDKCDRIAETNWCHNFCIFLDRVAIRTASRPWEHSESDFDASLLAAPKVIRVPQVLYRINIPEVL